MRTKQGCPCKPLDAQCSARCERLINKTSFCHSRCCLLAAGRAHSRLPVRAGWSTGLDPFTWGLDARNSTSTGVHISGRHGAARGCSGQPGSSRGGPGPIPFPWGPPLSPGPRPQMVELPSESAPPGPLWAEPSWLGLENPAASLEVDGRPHSPPRPGRGLPC